MTSLVHNNIIMPSLEDSSTENQTAELVTKIEKIEAEKAQLSNQLSTYDAMISRSEVVALGLSGTVQRLSDQMVNTDQSMEDTMLQLEQIQPDHQLVKNYRERCKKVA